MPPTTHSRELPHRAPKYTTSATTLFYCLQKSGVPYFLMPITMDTREGFRFMDLPPELRDMIYIEMLAPTGYVTLKRPEVDGEGLKAYPTRFTIDPRRPRSSELEYWTTKNGMSLKILRTCKTIYFEARHVFFQKNCLDLSLEDVYTDVLCGLLDRDLALDNSNNESLMLFARFVTIELGFDLRDLFRITKVWDVLGKSTKLEKLTLRNGREIDGLFFSETEASLYYDSQTKRHMSLEWLTLKVGGLKYLSNALGQKVQKTITFPGMRLCPPTGLFGNEIDRRNYGSSLIDTAKTFHGVFGGELWVNGTMWMKDGTEMDGLDKAIEKIREEGIERKRKQIEVLKNEEKREKCLKRLKRTRKT
ncbi:hypothetical protein DL95DRAFT_456012 [Leptodontidium sp. 2 PMI_412]|nr:hypothetical protein DL95DRAFT_456012 [Leptodontidium sp. 2 PMI_412]